MRLRSLIGRLRPAALALALSAVALCWLSAAPVSDARAASARDRCLRPGDQVAGETAEIVVTFNERLRVRDSDNESFWACYKPTGRRFRLDRYSHSDGMDVFPPAGRFVAAVAYEARAQEEESLDTVVFTMTDVRTRALYRIVRNRGSDGEIGEAVVKRNGSLAYVRYVRGHVGDYRAVWTCEMATCYDKNRRAVNDRAIDMGYIDFQSLKVAGSTLTWTNSGQARSALLR